MVRTHELRKFKFATMKLSDVENRCVARCQPPIDTCNMMKDELQTKYVPPLFSARLMDKWHQ